MLADTLRVDAEGIWTYHAHTSYLIALCCIALAPQVTLLLVCFMNMQACFIEYL